MKIVLIGFMGSGKSSVAPILANKLGLKSIEIDDLIVKKAGKPIAKIFGDGGESTFRQFETEVCQDLGKVDQAVISTGGGVVTANKNMRLLSQEAVIVALGSSFDTILSRISPGFPRPLFQNPIEARRLYAERLPLYEKYATIKVSTDNKSVEQVADEIKDSLQKL